MAISGITGAQSIVKPGVCTSSTKPASPYDGQVIYMTDVDQTAVWDGSQWTVLAPIAGGRNAIQNGAIMVDQKTGGSTVTSILASTVIDRWFVFSTGTPRFSAQQSTDAPVGLKNSLLITVTGTAGSPAAIDQNGLGQKIEGNNTARFLFGTANAKTVTISFWVKSSITGTYGVGIRNYDSTRSRVEQYTISTANTWEYKTVTIPGCTDGTWLTTNGIGFDVQWDLGTGSDYQQSSGTWTSANKYALSGSTKLTANSGATWRITGVQLEAGAVATPFEFEDYGTTLVKCQRYYEKTYDIGTAPGTATYNGMFTCGNFSNPTNNSILPVRFKVEKRASPTMTAYKPSDGGSGSWGYSRSGAAGTSAVTFDLLSTTGCRAYHDIGAAWTGNIVEAHWVASAEL